LHNFPEMPSSEPSPLFSHTHGICKQNQLTLSNLNKDLFQFMALSEGQTKPF
jgi:hypothetical protein